MAKKISDDEVRNIVQKRGFSLVCIYYKNKKFKRIIVKCPKKHIVNMCWSSFKRGRGCKKCCKNYAKKYQEVKQYIKSFGFLLLDDKYLNSQKKLKIKCPNNHIFEKTYNSFKSGSRCPYCYGNQRLTKECIQEKMNKENFKLLSKSYVNNRQKLKIECPNSHIFYMSWNSFNTGRRCNICVHPKKRENNCRDIFERITGKKFPTKRPKWLRDFGDRNPLELDGYCEELRIAFEYDGESHFIPIYGEKELEKQKKRDLKKDKLCKSYDIILIRISYKQENLEEFIQEKLKEIKCPLSKR